MQPTATGEITVNAAPESVYELISDPRSLAGLAEETVSCTLLDGATTVTIGTRFRGVNRRGVRRWSTVSTVTDAAPGRRFAFNVASMGIPVSRWTYSITPAENGCVVTESTWDRRPRWFLGLAYLATGVSDRGRTNTENIATTLRRLKEKAEA
ncbi:SRPBCC family protein [Kibdelosporangium phytohabitans]|uniref:Polyketide cyclase n=1 Tax=Kibdelosporangium phytohabitans TaxID=860235 RepID=A0A0N7F5I6_9PSEU|nr:SRPBCC family protein [Kibdelosporangium phytohabitans]ALG14335.1 polyketide cyclase [Kibdelosporangium phytohabitans]MBE1466646.1 ligand-binding SRPBCC domain-containing protein [Kibdelosporangium phytohabitans]